LKKFRVTYPVEGFQPGDSISENHEKFEEWLAAGYVAEKKEPVKEPVKKQKAVKYGDR